MILNALHNISGTDKIGNMYLLQGVAIAHELKLFGSSFQVKPGQLQHARDFTAWCFFGWLR